ncbi:hypothetical protein [Nocardiopsis xinjiangensis]|uniref:hypothetical protein n=1 Tax=Nocardiopsis xinjiangensis TaxID=124285 RepID=UPI001267C655|nr:hypothetical protein [Nocardiopsis xinjiangensis]
MSEHNGWAIAEWTGHRTLDKVQLLNRAIRDSSQVMRAVRPMWLQAWLRGPCPRHEGRALDKTGQGEKGRTATGIKRQNVGCSGGIADKSLW